MSFHRKLLDIVKPFQEHFDYLYVFSAPAYCFCARPAVQPERDFFVNDGNLPAVRYHVPDEHFRRVLMFDYFYSLIELALGVPYLSAVFSHSNAVLPLGDNNIYDAFIADAVYYLRACY